MYKILIVEDDSALRYVYSKMKAWKNCGFIIASEASNGKEALEILEKETFDLVMTDIRMPFVDGLSLLKAIKEKNIDTFSILVSSYNEFEYARQGLILGASDFIVKPVNEKNLTEVLERAKIYLGEKSKNNEISEIVIKAVENLGIDVENDSFLKNIFIYLSENMGQNITMEDASYNMKLSKDYFGKTFKQHTGMTFNSVYMIIKIEYAKSLIKTCRYKNYEISDMLGYSSADYFTKIFKDITGMTPTQYKNSII